MGSILCFPGSCLCLEAVGTRKDVFVCNVGVRKMAISEFKVAA